MDYKTTIITPKTDFPMRGGLPQREPAMLEGWNKIDIYAELRKKNAGKPRFVLHDGPPFSNGDIHMGHALNKTLKDFIVRSCAMRGFDTPYVPGWDNHGMPIESAIIKKNKLNRKAMSVPDFRSACRDFALDRFDADLGGAVCLSCVSTAPFISNGARRILMKLPRTPFDRFQLIDGHPDWPEAARHFRGYINQRMHLDRFAPPLAAE